MYGNVRELIEESDNRQVPVWKCILENECRLTEATQEQVFEKLRLRYEVMDRAAHKALYKPQPSVGDLITGVASNQEVYANSKNTISGDFLNHIMALALSSSEVNAAMGKICAAPTAGSCGIIPAVIIGVAEQYQLPMELRLQGLLTASGIGAIIVKNATVSGAEGGCQAECGVAAAMASAAVVQMKGGTNEMIQNAISICFLNCMGLICDPVAGLVQFPCAQRNASQAVNAIISADMALAGMKSAIPVDEVIEAMYKVGKQLPVELKETALGGVAATPTGKHLKENIFKK